MIVVSTAFQRTAEAAEPSPYFASNYGKEVLGVDDIMKIKIKRFGLPDNPGQEKRVKNRITRHIILFLCSFIVIASL